LKRKTIFLDRDGTIIEDIPYLNDPDKINYLPNVFKALKNLREAGYSFVIVTNQSGVPRGLVKIENLHEIHNRIQREFSKHGIEFLEFYYAPHLPDSQHHTRKPNPGMLLLASDKFDIDLSKSWMIGDKLSDVEAGVRAGVKSILLTSKDNIEIKEPYAPEVYLKTLWEASQYIESHQK